MKKYSVQVDIVMSASIEVEAESEEQALRLAEKKAKNEPLFFIKKGWYVGSKAICANEENE
jgi:hypothetical protein